MVDMKLQVVFVSIAWAVGATYREGWSTTGCTTTIPASQWSTCTPIEITVVETQTILQAAPPITALETSIIKSGTVLNTSQTATASALKPRDYKGWGSNWDTKPAKSWAGWELCSPSTLTKTLTEYITSIIAPSTTTKTLIETQPASTLSCSEGCKLDVTATKLIYPTSVIHVTVPITVDTLPEPHTPEILTWEYNGVILTYPTTYLLYTELSHAFLATTSTAFATTCPTASGSLTLPSPTNYAPLIYPQQETPGPDLPPSALISYLNGQETVLIQLSGTPIGSSCDPVGGGIVEPVPVTGPAQVVYTSTYILAQPTTSSTSTVVVVAPVKTTSTTKTLVVITGSTSTSTSTSSDVASTTPAPTFASTGTTTVVLLSSSSAPPPVETVTVADAPTTARRFEMEGFLLAAVSFLLTLFVI